MRRYPYRPYWVASRTIDVVNAASSSRTFGFRRCVARDCPTTEQARRSDTVSCERTCSTHARLREGLSINGMVRPVLLSENVALTKEERNEEPQSAA